MPRAAAKTVIDIPTNPALVQVRTQGLTLTSPLKPLVDGLEVVDSDSYLEADMLLGRIANARAVWKTKIDPVLVPLKRAVDAAKLAMEGAKKLNTDVDGPLEEMEVSVKGSMKTYKLLEAQQEQERVRLETAEANRLRDEAAAKERAALAAKTAPMRAKLEQARADLEAKAEVVQQQAMTPTVVKGGASSDRWTDKIKITDLSKLVNSMIDYVPHADIYRKNEAPWSLLNNPRVLGAIQIELNKIFDSQPGIVETWPGCEIYRDVTIARR